MPISAFVNGERRVAIDFKPEEWDSLKRTRPSIELCCCQAKGFMRTSQRGTKHFVHARKAETCTSGPETELHLHFKTVIAEAIREAGWVAQVEERGPEGVWRADVMARRGRWQYAFEVQLSPISLLELQRRHQVYADNNVKGCWFYGIGALDALPSRASSELPLYPICPDETVRIGTHVRSMKDAVVSLLRGHFKFCEKARTPTTQNVVVFRFSHCWACGEEFDIFSVMERKTYCWHEPVADQGADNGSPLELKQSGAPWIVARVEQFVRANPQLSIQVRAPGWFYAQSSQRKHYTFCCYHCGTFTAEDIFEQLLFGDEYGACIQDPSYCLYKIASFRLRERIAFEEEPHWCYSRERRFCET